MQSVSCNNEMTIENKIIATLSISVGLFVLYFSIPAFYSYMFTDSIHSYVRPLQELVVDFLFSTTAIIAGLFLFLKRQKALTLYYSLGTGILMYNLIKILAGQKEVLGYEGTIVKLFTGTLIMLYFTSKYGLRHFDEAVKKKNFKEGLIIGILMSVPPILLFHNYLFQEQLI